MTRCPKTCISIVGGQFFVCLEHVLSQVFEIVQSCAAMLPVTLKNLKTGGFRTIQLLRARLHA